MGSKRAAKPFRPGRGIPPSLWYMLAAVLLGFAALSGVIYGGKSFYTHVLVQNVLESPISEPPQGLKLDAQQHAADEMLLRQLVDECSRRQDTVIYLDSQRRMVVTNNIDPQHCPLLDIMLRGSERGVGTCTDVALYVMHAGGRIIPMPADVEAYDSYCGPQTARLFLESMYHQFISTHKGVLHLQLVNSEHLWTADAAMHAQMQAFLCKTQFCNALMQQHVVNSRYWASVWFMGHTSFDPSVGISGDVTAQVQASVSRANPKGFAVHVRGKSGLKQTKAVLDCWAQHPEFPALVVVGKVPDGELSPESRAAANVVYYPRLADSSSSGGSGGSGSNDTSSSVKLQPGQEGEGLIDAAHVRDLQAAAFLHICPSVREGFGLYLNEARAAGALVVTTNHPPMNELVTPEQGLLVPTYMTKSEAGTELGKLVHLNGHVSPEGLCQVVQQALALPAAEAAKKRAAATAAYQVEQAEFLHRMAQLRAHLQARTAAAAGTDTVSAATEAAAASIALSSGSSGSSLGGPVNAKTLVGAASSQRAVGDAGRRMGPS